MQDTTTVLTARPNALAKAFWGRYFERSVRRSFSQVLIGGEHHHVDLWRKGQATEPLILYCTHFGWWDAALTIYLSLRVFEFDAFGMMEEANLRKYAFLRRIGLFGVDLADRRRSFASLKYAAGLLQGTGRTLWMFPQGELRPQEARPLDLKSGVSVLLRSLGSAWFAPVVLRYDVLHRQHPRAVVNIGAAERLLWTHHSTIEDTTKLFEQRLTALADTVEDHARTESFDGYRLAMSGRRSMEQRYDIVAGRR